jgi:two-component system, NtrC family, sensor kinase
LFNNAFLELLAPKFYESNKSFFDSIKGFALTWVIGFSFYAQRQGKRERKQRLKEEEERAILEGKKQELECQVAERTVELTRQKEELEQTVIELKTTQKQLVHAEKMASLGELTAGIAHEIQNPLNFVNNFSEVSVELCQEITEELEKEVFDKTYIAEILSDLNQNQQKITHHGQRAASIVKGMLQHSRKSTGQKELTDINALTDEYLRLSYHGLRAKDKSFMADFKTNLDPNLPKIMIIPQDFGRVLLNCINNGFYAVQQKNMQNLDGYKPLVNITTFVKEDEIIIKIRDNGTGMPETVKAKIFQPFFTTKPTGQGTGLGLSLAYDIVTKGHGGTMEVESAEGEWTEFVIKLPIA